MSDIRTQYLQGKLAPEEMRAYESSLSEEELKELAFEVGVQEGIVDRSKKNIREQLQEFESKGKRGSHWNYSYVGIAASIFAVATITFYLSRSQPSLYDQYYEVYPNYEVTSLRGSDDPSIREEAYLAYDQGNFGEAIRVFNALDSLSSADVFFRGICHIQQTNYEDALFDFAAVISTKEPNYYEAAVWYTALIHLKQEDKAKATPFLQELSLGNSEFSKASMELLASF